MLQRFADHVLTGSARQHFAAGVLVFNPEIDDVVTRVAHRAHDEARVEARLGGGLELLRNARCLLARLLERIGPRRELPPHQINADHHEREQQHDRVAEAIGERFIQFRRIDFDHHAEAGESHRAVSGHHAVIGIVERLDDAGLEVERMAHWQQLSVDATGNVRRSRIRIRRPC